MIPCTHGKGALSFLAACLAGGQILWAAPTAGAQAAEGRLGRRSGPRYSSYLASLPMGAFVEALSLDQLAEVIVTDTKAAQPQESVTQRVQIVYGEDFDQTATPNRNLAELLSYCSGQFVNVLSRNDANWGSFGGLGPKYNTYLLDGLPMDSFADAMSLDPWAFDRIELQQGPASVLYSNYMSMDFAGNEAPLAGTTHFVLKDRIEGPMARIQVNGGSFESRGGRLYLQDRRGDFSYFAGAGYEQARYTNYGADPSWLNILEDPAYKKHKFYGKASYRLGPDDHEVSLFVHHTTHSGEVGRPNRDYLNQYDLMNLSYSLPLGDSVRLSAKSGYRAYDRNWGEDNYPTDENLRAHDRVDQKILPTDLTLTVQHLGSSLLSLGLCTQFASYRTYATESGIKHLGNDVKARTLGAFIQEKVVSGPWIWRVGGRFEHTSQRYQWIGGSRPGVDETSWDKVMWSAGVRFNALPSLALFGNASNSFIPPSAKAVGGTLQESDAFQPGKDGQLPNGALRPEKGIGTDLGLDFHPPGSLNITLRAFYNKVDDAIVDEMVSINPSQVRSINAGQSRSQGLEFGIDQTLHGSYRWFGNLTCTHAELRNAFDPDQDGASTPFVPSYIGNLGATLALPLGLTVSPYLQAVGRYFDSGSLGTRRAFGRYRTINLKAQASLSRNTRHAVSLILELNNLGNKRFEMPWQFRDPGFNFLASLQVIF